MRNGKVRVLVLFSGKGKTAWFEKIASGEMPDSVLHAFARLEDEHLEISYVDTEPRRWKTIRKILGSDVVIAGDTSPFFCLAGLIGVRTFLVCVNTSSILRKTKGLRLALLKLCWRHCAGIICLARFQMQDMEHVGVRKERLTFIPLGIDTTFMQKETSSAEEYVVSVGQDTGRDYEYLLQMAPYIAHPIRIVTREQNIPRDTLLPENVSVEYNIPVTEMRERIAQARVVVLPSKQRIEDGSDCSGQTVVLQALAAGKPVVASVRPWISDYLKESRDFIALPDGNVEAAAATINMLWENAPLRERLSEAGKKTVEENFTTQKFAISLREFVVRRATERN